MAKVTGSYLIAKTLKEEGVEKLFYLMGGPDFDIVMACQDLGIDTIDFRHEQAAAFAAHAYARVTGKPGVLTAASGPGTLNLLTGVYTASVDCAPMVILGGAGPVHEIGRDAFQEVDQESIMKPLCKYWHRPTMAARYPEIVSTAYRQAQSGRPGPVYIDCGADVLYEEIEESDAIAPTRAAKKSVPSGDPAAVKEAIDMLAAAEKPIIFGGGGVFFSGGAPELEKLVDLTSTPFYTAPMSRGLVPEDHVVSFQAARSTAMRETDLVMVIGTRMNWMLQYGRRFPNAKVVQVDIDGGEIAHNRDVDLGIVGDAKAVLGQMVAEVESRPQDFAGRLESEWVTHLREENDRRATQSAAVLNSSDKPIHPLRLCKEIRDFLDRDAILCVDGNEILHFGRQSLPTFLPGHRLNSGVTGTMGVGLPYGIGAKIAKPDKQVLVLHGDGSMGMNAMELDTCVRHNLPVVTVISNNAGWTARTPDQRKPGRELGFTNFDGMARELGAYGELVEDADEIRPALERAFASGKPAVVNVIVEPTAAGVSRSWGGSRME
ncbi:MAG: thiamine pyrophosphate-binding protein [Chloroflexi bacterium]|nr:thiamine pyrophosphate-binding protein [Chloroflexota bacterium]MCI0791764.1 thiamine pyrophosphate-binding protein [Chloroflexota bacterium]MCI0840234.1 thiamine pyrophosphate-binding protein [Chloroflexota bacterium]